MSEGKMMVTVSPRPYQPQEVGCPAGYNLHETNMEAWNAVIGKRTSP